MLCFSVVDVLVILMQATPVFRWYAIQLGKYSLILLTHPSSRVLLSLCDSWPISGGVPFLVRISGMISFTGFKLTD